MTHFFDINHILASYGYTGIFLIVFLESGVFFSLPGDSLLFTAGLLAAVFNLNIFGLIFVASIGGLFGGIVGYYIGTYIEKLRKYSFFNRILKQEYIDRAHQFFKEHGKFALIFSRFIPVIRTFTPIAAGVSHVPYPFFMKYNFLGAILWPVTMILAGHFLGQSFPILKDHLTLVVVAIIGLSFVPTIYELLKKKS